MGDRLNQSFLFQLCMEYLNGMLDHFCLILELLAACSRTLDLAQDFLQ